MMSISSILYPRYKELRREHPGLPAKQAFLWARGEVVRRCRNKLIGKHDPRHPDMVEEARSRQTAHFEYNGYPCALEITPDDMLCGDDVIGFKRSRNVNPYREAGWGHDGMDRGLYAVDTEILVAFDETRLDVIKYAPKGMSKQAAYEWATQSMRDRLAYYKKYVRDDIETFVVTLGCEALGIYENLGCVTIDVTDPASDKYVEEIVDELYDQFVHEFDKHKKIA